jgi:hypothetical protein
VSARIPVYLLEEHHEAFPVWHAAVRDGVLPARGNTLLHFDEHADIGSPRLHEPLPRLGEDVREVWRFTYEQLSCFEFIVPAVFLGMFDQLYWIQHRPPERSDQVVIVQATGPAARSFELRSWPVTGPGTTSPLFPVPGGGWTRYRHQTIAEPFEAGDSVVLDVDLDYFSCEDAVNLVQRLEVSREEFDAFQKNPYHFLKISQGSRIRMREEGGRCFVYLRHYAEPMPTPLRADAEEIGRRVDALVAYLERHAVKPRLVNFARSRFSGYTPADQWQLIERLLLDGLERLYALDVRVLEEIPERA